MPSSRSHDQSFATTSHGCGSPSHQSRRTLLGAAALGGVSWMTPVAQLLAREQEKKPQRKPAQSVIFLWLGGGPSQLETFDPHPRKKIAAGTRAIKTATSGVQLAEGLEQLAEQMASISLVRSLVSKEGDHERGTYMAKTGFRPLPALVHPTIGAVCVHQLAVGKTEIPRHVSILPGSWPGWGGFLGSPFDAFKTGDPARKVSDVTLRTDQDRHRRRIEDLAVVERAFSRGRGRRVAATQHSRSVKAAQRMMASEQLAAFDVAQEPASLLSRYGDTPFGRGCLAARRLIEVGVRCVEVTLSGWDSHTNNHETHRELLKTLDPAFATLIADLKDRGRLDDTIVVCGGEFGRTPRLNALAGRDHWPHGFSMALAGGGIRGGLVIGQTDPQGSKRVEDPQPVENLHATILIALGIETDAYHKTMAPGGRPIPVSDGKPIKQLLRSS